MSESDDSDNVGIALLLTMGAGAATALGAAVVFIPWAVKYASRKTLAGSLGLSAGVMTYVSFVEILQKSINAFGDGGMSVKESYRYATICFFAGVVFMVVSCCVTLGYFTFRYIALHYATLCFSASASYLQSLLCAIFTHVFLVWLIYWIAAFEQSGYETSRG